MGRIIGIDLGTTNSLAAFWDGEKSVLIPNRFGEYLTPSAVCVEEDGTLSVGKLARERQLVNPELCADEFKRGMGTDKTYLLGERSFSAEELSALVLRTLKEDAERFLGEPVEEAVVSVPAYFADKARRATRRAGVLAGLKVDRIVNEPSAAALAFRQQHGEAQGNMLVFDFGGGTLDVSLVDCFENVVEITAVSGDNRLGGLDFDQVLASNFCAAQGTLFELQTPVVQEQLLRTAERTKRMLTVAESAPMHFSSETLSGEWAVSRKKLIQLSARLFERIGKPVKRVLADGNVLPKNLTGVVMVGGSCKMPVVQDYLRFLLRGCKVETVHPDAMVALGVGIYAGMKERHGEMQDLILTDICPFSLGTNIINHAENGNPLMSTIIPRNSALPTSRQCSYATARDNQTAMVFGIYQGEDMYVKNNLKIAEITFDPIPLRPAGEVSALLRYTYDINGILLVDATLLATGEEKHLVLGADDADERTRQQIALLERLRSDPHEAEENKLLLSRARSVYQQLTNAFAKERLAAQIQRFEITMAQDIYMIQKEGTALMALLDELEKKYLDQYDIPDAYLDSFLDWYENNSGQDEDDEQGWSPK